MTRKSVQGGYCNWPDTAGCALTKLECDNPENFLSSRQMQDGPVRAHGGSCRWQDAIRETVLGRCKEGDVNTSCASDPKACPEDTDGWLSADPECTVETTSFGRCDYGMCAWTHDQCHEDNTWKAFDEGCSCENVQVGACSRMNGDEREVFCAVSELGCDQEQTWITPQEVKNAVGFDCYLCREVSVSQNSDSTAVAEDAASVAIGGNRETSSRTIIVTSAILGTVIAFSIISLVAWKVFKARRAVKRALDGGRSKEEAPPTLAIEMNMDENHHSTDMDDASVLSAE